MKKFFKILGLVILGLLVLPLLIALFVKKEYSVEREISIAKPKQVVFDYVKFLRNQDNYSVWAKIDPGMKKEYRGTDGTVGFVSGWDSYIKMAGKGEQEILKIADGERIDYEIRFYKPMKATNNAFMALKSVDDNTTNVKWCFTGKVRYPMNFMLLFIKMDAIVGNDLARGLQNFKAELEK